MSAAVPVPEATGALQVLAVEAAAEYSDVEMMIKFFRLVILRFYK